MALIDSRDHGVRPSQNRTIRALDFHITSSLVAFEDSRMIYYWKYIDASHLRTLPNCTQKPGGSH